MIKKNSTNKGHYISDREEWLNNDESDYCLNCNTMIRTVLLFLLIILCDLSIAQLSSSGYVLTGKDSIYYETSGYGKVIILIHDGLIHSEVWENQFAFFAENYKVIRYDRRGYSDAYENNPYIQLSHRLY